MIFSFDLRATDDEARRKLPPRFVAPFAKSLLKRL